MADTLVVVCAIMGPGDSRYMMDALRWVQVVEAKGVSPANIHLFAHESRRYEAKGIVEGLHAAEPTINFSLSPPTINTLGTYRRGDPDKFLQSLLPLVNNPAIVRVTIILNHGDYEGAFGNDDVKLQQNGLFAVLTQITKPAVIVCSACYAKRIFFLLDREHKQDNFVKIWDDGTAQGITYNWGVKIRDEPVYDLGTQLSYWLFDALYAANEQQELYSFILENIGKTKLTCIMNISGNVKLLNQHSFFGPIYPAPFSQVQPEHAITTTSPMLNVKRPQFTDELVDLTDEFLRLHTQEVPLLFLAEFWKWVYEKRYSDLALQLPGGYELGMKIGTILKHNKLTTVKNNGAGLPDVMVVYELANQFLNFLRDKSL